MLDTVKGFLYHHRRKLIASGVIVGGIVLGTRYAQRKIMQWQEKEAKAFMESARHQQHYESMERTCNKTILSLAPSVREAIVAVLPTEEILSELRKGGLSTENKKNLWDELKVLTFAQVLAFVYAGVMIVIVLRIQLSLVGGLIHKTSGSNDNSCLSSSVQEKYLLLCQHFLGEGVKELCLVIKENTCLMISEINLTESMSLKKIETLFWKLQSSINSDENGPLKNLSKYLLPSNNNEFVGEDAEKMSLMLKETLELLASEEVTSLAVSCVSQGYSNLLDQVAEFFMPNLAQQPNDSSSAKTSDMTTPMAKLVPIVHRMANRPSGNSDVPEPWIQHVILNRKIKTLGMNVYEAFCQIV